MIMASDIRSCWFAVLSVNPEISLWTKNRSFSSNCLNISCFSAGCHKNTRISPTTPPNVVYPVLPFRPQHWAVHLRFSFIQLIVICITNPCQNWNTMKFLSCGTRIWLHLYDKSNVPRAIFQMFETHSTPLWPRSDNYKLGSEHPIFSWLTGMNNSSEDNIVV